MFDFELPENSIMSEFDEIEREDGDGADERRVAAPRFRRFMSEQVRRQAIQGDRICADLTDLERLAEPYFLGLDHDEDTSDIDDLT